MLRLNVRQGGPVFDGHVDLDIQDAGDHWNVNWGFHVRLGRKVWGKFVGSSKDGSGSISVPKEHLTQAWLDTQSAFSLNGASLQKTGPQSWNFSKNQVSGSMNLRYDGDPVEPDSLVINALGMSFSAGV